MTQIHTDFDLIQNHSSKLAVLGEQYLNINTNLKDIKDISLKNADELKIMNAKLDERIDKIESDIVDLKQSKKIFMWVAGTLATLLVSSGGIMLSFFLSNLGNFYIVIDKIVKVK